MITQILTRFRRAPVQALAVVFLSAVLCASLCGLHAANISAKAHCEQTCASVPVKLTVTNLSGTRSDGLEAPSWVTRVFTSKLVDNGLKDYVKNVQIKATQTVDSVTVGDAGFYNMGLIGITDLEISGEMSQGSSITWLEGYDDAVFASDDAVCVVPECMLQGVELGDMAELTMTYSEPYQSSTYTVSLQIVGYHKGSDTSIYTPCDVVMEAYDYLGKPDEVDAIQATLTDNSLRDQVREIANNWFAEPNPTGEKTSWRYSFYFYYPYALQINDDLLVNAERTLKISLLINEICAVLVFVLSAGASFFVGFLMIRSRKREIALMRSLGTPVIQIFLSMALEQLLCLGVGTFAGGYLFGFQPVERVLAFVLVYASGLCLALMIFLGKNLMTTLKEDE